MYISTKSMQMEIFKSSQFHCKLLYAQADMLILRTVCNQKKEGSKMIHKTRSI